MTVIPLLRHCLVLSSSFAADRLLHATAVTDQLGERGSAKRTAPLANNEQKCETAVYKPKVNALLSAGHGS